MSKKAQNTGQIFIYILATVIIGVIFLFGYQSIKGFQQRADDVALVQFQKNLESQIKTLAPQFGSLKKIEIPISSDFKEVCFIRYDTGDVLSSLPDPWDGYPLIEDAFDADTQKNIFLINRENQIEESYEIGKVKFTGTGDPLLKCYVVVDGILNMTLQGKGNHVMIS